MIMNYITSMLIVIVFFGGLFYTVRQVAIGREFGSSVGLVVLITVIAAGLIIVLGNIWA